MSFKCLYIILCAYVSYCFIACSCDGSANVIAARSGRSLPSSSAGLCDHASCECSNFQRQPTVTLLQWIIINCTFLNQEDVTIDSNSFPKKTREILFNGGQRVTFNENSFGSIEDLAIFTLDGFKNVHILQRSFYNLSSNHAVIRISNCDYLTIETGAFKDTKGPTVNISQCGHVTLQGRIFTKLNLMGMNDIKQLELEEGAFELGYKSNHHHGPNTKIWFQNVKIKVIPRKAFGSTVDEIRFQNVDVYDVQGDAFSATFYNSVIAINSSFYKFYKGALTQKTFIQQKLEFKNCTIKSLATDAIQSTTNNLIIQYSKIKEVANKALSLTVVKVILEDNEFGVIHTQGFEFLSWSTIKMERNVFDKLETDPIACSTGIESQSFTFIHNGIFNISRGGLKFISDVQTILPSIEYESTYFDQDCLCKIESWLVYILSKNSSFVQHVVDNSYCTVKVPLLAKCYNLHQESMLIRNYTLQTCGENSNITCLSGNKSGDVDVQNSKFLNRKNQIREAEEAAMLINKKIVRIILIVASIGIVLIVVFVIVKRSGLCIPISNSTVSSNNCCLKIFDRICNINYGMDTARSISRLSIHEYNESHRLNETRILDLTDVADDQIDIEVPMIDKATQTLPEELTKELLENLREKLDDPENYSEAREMIEHLYDLIKVEESCNSNNNIGSTAEYVDDQDNLYDVIQVPVRRKGKNNKIMVNVGTRVPSLERLLQQSSPYQRATALCHEYFEPTDRTMHLYAELPSDRNSSHHMPDIVGERSRDSRPLSFLRAIGEKIQQPQSSASGTVRSIDSASRMANRPLPEKPKDPGEGPSFQRH